MASRQLMFLDVDVGRWSEGRAAIKSLTKRGWTLVTDAASETFMLHARSGLEIKTPELTLTFERFGDPRLLRLNAERLKETVDALSSACSDGFEIDWDDQAEDCFCYAVVRHHPQPGSVLTDDEVVRGAELVMAGDPIFIVSLFLWRRSRFERLLGPDRY